MSYCQSEGLPALHFGKAKYERGKIYFDKALYENCLIDIQPIIESGKWDSDTDKIDEKNFFWYEEWPSWSLMPMRRQLILYAV